MDYAVRGSIMPPKVGGRGVQVMRRFASVLAAVVAAAGLSAAPQQPIRSGVSLVRVPVVVTGRDGTLVRGLRAEDFDVREDGVRQSVAFFADGTPASATVPLHIGLLLDVSESMRTELAQAAGAAVRFVNALEEAIDVTLVDFDAEVRLATFEPPQYERLFERLRARRPSGNTALYDAIAMYLRRAAAESGQKVLLMYTDGGDSISALRYGQLLTLLKQSDVLVYPIGYTSVYGRGGAEQMQLGQMARETGGQAFFPDDARELNAIYARILDEITSRYTLGYVSTNPGDDGAWRTLEVRVTRADAARAKVRARPGYYAPGVR